MHVDSIALHSGEEWWKKPSVATWLAPVLQPRFPLEQINGSLAESTLEVLSYAAKDECHLQLPDATRLPSCTVQSESLPVSAAFESQCHPPKMKDLCSSRTFSCDSLGGLTASTSAATPMRGSISSDAIDDDLMAFETSCTPKAIGPSLVNESSFLKVPLIAPPQVSLSASLAHSNFQRINQHVQLAILTFLHGYEAASLTAVAPFLKQRLQNDAVWDIFFKQEAICAGVQKSNRLCAREAYYNYIVHSTCRSLVWHRVPCSHDLGAREGSPAVFTWGGFLFVYGGWGRMGPVVDLHVGVLQHPLVLKRIPITGRGPPPSYEMQVTLLDTSNGSYSIEQKTLRVAITGGYRSGGYRNESGGVAIFELSFPPNCSNINACPDATPEEYQHCGCFPTATWIYVGSSTPRSNHTATYVPSDFSGSRYKDGFLLIFGGNVSGRAVNTVDVLDLEDMTWELDKHTSGPAPTPRNSHSALLLPACGGHEILVMGGCTGDATNGGPPRGGSDLHSAHWLDPKNFSWRGAPEAEGGYLGRGHIAVNLFGTAVVISGGRQIQLRTSAFSRHISPSSWEVSALPNDTGLPMPRILGGGCTLPDGTIILYGGWHPMLGTFDDIWSAHVDGAVTDFCAPLYKGTVNKSTAWKSPLRRKPKPAASSSSWGRCCQNFCKKMGSALSVIRSHCFGQHDYNAVSTAE